jgi:ABC-type Fe3+/spermidine/putrescine transport system ATPase subunit
VVAVAGVDLVIEDGEFFTLLGPSGSGKTTLLRMIAGFERPDAGRIELAGRDVTTLPPNMRDTNTVFQDYALFPHMTVGQNIGYGLRIKHIAGAERQQRVDRALRMVRLQGLGKRRPNQLSGGQRQRVAIARALILEPRILLLDEPTSALDVSVQAEILNLLGRLRRDHGLTALMVSHDLAVIAHLCERIAVMSHGAVIEVTTAEALASGRVTHPYTRDLLRSNRGFDRSGAEIVDVAS